MWYFSWMVISSCCFQSKKSVVRGSGTNISSLFARERLFVFQRSGFMGFVCIGLCGSVERELSALLWMSFSNRFKYHHQIDVVARSNHLPISFVSAGFEP